MLNFDELFNEFNCECDCFNDSFDICDTCDPEPYPIKAHIPQSKTLSPPISMPSSSKPDYNNDFNALYNDSDLRESNFLRRMQSRKEASDNQSCKEIGYKPVPVAHFKPSAVSNVKVKLSSMSQVDLNLRRKANCRRALRSQQRTSGAEIVEDRRNEKANDIFIELCEVW